MYPNEQPTKIFNFQMQDLNLDCNDVKEERKQPTHVTKKESNGAWSLGTVLEANLILNPDLLSVIIAYC